MAAKKKNEFLMYKNRPLVRKGNTIYYGSLSDDFVLMLQILSTKDVNGLQMADRVSVQLINTDPDVRPHDRIAHKTEKKGLYSALDIGTTWLERALS
ncbi:MAG: hypothetical protein Q4D20_03555 [Clostridia bacterium]|mgnify:FL=1|nr:hypothetical protein [Clostridia bacterium]